MKYERDLSAAAQRHLDDGKLLAGQRRWDNAGYHFGLAAECALKAAMEKINIRENEFLVDGKDAYYIHFPDLKNMTVSQTGRISVQISQALQQASFMQNWVIKMRYSKKVVPEQQCDKWSRQATNFVNNCLYVGI